MIYHLIKNGFNERFSTSITNKIYSLLFYTISVQIIENIPFSNFYIKNHLDFD